MVEFYLLTFPRFPLRKKEHKTYFGKNRTHDFRTTVGVQVTYYRPLERRGLQTLHTARNLRTGAFRSILSHAVRGTTVLLQYTNNPETEGTKMGDMLHAPYEVGWTYLIDDRIYDLLLRSRSNKAQTDRTDVKRVLHKLY